MNKTFNIGDKIISIPHNKLATVIDHMKDDTYYVVDDKGNRSMIYSNYWELEDSPVILRPGDTVYHNVTKKIGKIIGPAYDYGNKVSDLVVNGSMSGPEPLYFIDTDDRADYREQNGNKRKIIDSRNVLKFVENKTSVNNETLVKTNRNGSDPNLSKNVSSFALHSDKPTYDKYDMIAHYIKDLN
jgi:hypothetical protein